MNPIHQPINLRPTSRQPATEHLHRPQEAEVTDLQLSRGVPWGKFLPLAIAAVALVWGAVLHAQTEDARSQSERTSMSTVCSACSSAQARRILDTVQIEAVLELGYEPTGERRDEQLAALAAMTDIRTVRNGDGALRFGRSEHPSGGWQLHLTVTPAGAQVSPDATDVDVGVADEAVTADREQRQAQHLQRLQETLVGLVEASVDAPSRPLDLRDLSFEVFTLSYAQSDRTLALLKAMGYTTVEFQQSKLEQSRWEKIFDVVDPSRFDLPVVVKLLDSDKTSLLQPLEDQLPPAAQKQNPQQVQARTAVPEIGGQFLHQTSTGEPLQRLLLLYDPSEPQRMQRLMELLQGVVDVPARQIVIEAVVIEVNTERLGDLGFSFQFGEDKVSGSFQQGESGRQEPFSLTFDDLADLKEFRISLTALVEDGDAEILSNPSVLVLDGRQARIQVGQQIPIVSSAATVGVVAQSVEYFPVGIVLNLRPRLNSSATDVTMQVETIVSAVTSNSTQAIANNGDVFFAPTIDNRRVQTLVRVADNTPFIIGGLISTEERERISRVPGISKIPFLGELFKRRAREKVKTEVIVVITPHVVPSDVKGFNYVIPKESDRFDSFDHQLFRNTYRIRQGDVFDLRFVEESGVLENLRDDLSAATTRRPTLGDDPTVQALLAGEIPGEDILVERMLWETARRSGAAQHVQSDRIILFERPTGSDDLELRFLRDLLSQRSADANTLRLAFRPDVSADAAPRLRPATPSYERMEPSQYAKRLKLANGLNAFPDQPQAPTILLGPNSDGADPLDVLKSVLVLKRILDLNQSLPLEIDEFYVGRQIVYPSSEDLTSSFHVVDARTAELFFAVQHYYPAFEEKFNRALARARTLLADE